MSIPVVIVEKGGFPVKAVDSRAPVMKVAENGMGAPVVLSDRGAPFIIEGLEWTPLELGSKLLAWWDASQGLTLSGSQVTAWADRKNGYSAAQAVSSARPIYAATSFNGQPGLTLDGVDDELTLPSQPFASDSEMWGVAQQDALAADTTVRMLVCYGGNTSQTSARINRVVTTGVNRASFVVGTGASTVGTANTAVDLSSRHLIRSRISGGNLQLSVDGGTETAVAGVPSLGSTRFRIGAYSADTAANFWKGQIRDMIVTSPLTSEEAAALQTFLLARRAL